MILCAHISTLHARSRDKMSKCSVRFHLWQLELTDDSSSDEWEEELEEYAAALITKIKY